MEANINLLFEKMCDKQDEEAFLHADKLAKIGGEEVKSKLIDILKGEDKEDAYLAARALSLMDDNQDALEPMLEVIHDHANSQHNGLFVQALEGFDLSEKFVDIFRIYLFGNFKASLLAKQYLDYTEFDITPRVIRKAEKHWKHFQNNSRQDDSFDLKNMEVESILTDLKAMFEE